MLNHQLNLFNFLVGGNNGVETGSVPNSSRPEVTPAVATGSDASTVGAGSAAPTEVPGNPSSHHGNQTQNNREEQLPHG